MPLHSPAVHQGGQTPVICHHSVFSASPTGRGIGRHTLQKLLVPWRSFLSPGVVLVGGQQNHSRIFTTMQDQDQDELPTVLVKFKHGGSRVPPASVRFPHLTFLLRKFKSYTLAQGPPLNISLSYHVTPASVPCDAPRPSKRQAAQIISRLQ